MPARQFIAVIDDCLRYANGLSQRSVGALAGNDIKPASPLIIDDPDRGLDRKAILFEEIQQPPRRLELTD
ncbi:hypothetical protein OO17_13170 [Rhodopseudomonas palustris]|uniref:Uncharacterized protein n=1 Tax=Rhodopseudomonas palustris TaxID=1076 RepID=A0A0D7ENT6_RHOPL|nr:hypothetical protein OO17_13170 [Rhodopseudomonas palustris]